MKVYFLTILSFCCLFVFRAQAQCSAGISGGYTNNEFYTNISNYNYNYYKKGSGFVVSVPIQYGITK